MNLRRQSGQCRPAFTLLEVMLAVALFFMVGFAVLALVSQNLRGARMLQSSHVSASMLAAQLSQTNRLEEGITEGTFDAVVPNLYPGYTYMQEVAQVSSNGLFQVNFAVMYQGRLDSTMSILLYRPGSMQTLGGGLPRRR